MNHQRRDALKAAGGLGVFGLLAAIGFIRPELAHAARNEAAFSAKSLDAVVAALGATTPTESGIKKHPAVAVRQDALSTLVRVGSLLGLDPTSYRRLMGGGGSGDPEGDNEFRTF